MKKFITLAMIAVMSLSMLSCDIEANRPLTKDVTVVLKNIPSKVKAVAIFCNLNEWKADNVNGNSTYISTVENGTATWVFKGYTLATPLKFQFTPMPSADTKMGDNWWSYALSGSNTYANEENNLYCNFISKGIKDNCTITLTKAKWIETGGNWSPFPIYGIDSTRQYNENFKKCFDVE